MTSQKPSPTNGTDAYFPEISKRRTAGDVESRIARNGQRQIDLLRTLRHVDQRRP